MMCVTDQHAAEAVLLGPDGVAACKKLFFLRYK